MPDITLNVAATANTGDATDAVAITAPYRIDVQTTSDAAWLTFEDTATSSADFIVHGGNSISGNAIVDTDQLAAGNHTGTLTMTATNNTCGGNLPFEIEVQATIS